MISLRIGRRLHGDLAYFTAGRTTLSIPELWRQTTGPVAKHSTATVIIVYEVHYTHNVYFYYFFLSAGRFRPRRVFIIVLYQTI